MKSRSKGRQMVEYRRGDVMIRRGQNSNKQKEKDIKTRKAKSHICFSLLDGFRLNFHVLHCAKIYDLGWYYIIRQGKVKRIL